MKARCFLILGLVGVFLIGSISGIFCKEKLAKTKGGSMASVKDESKKLPKNFFFRSNDLSLEKNADLVQIKSFPRWSNAQVPPPKDFDFTPTTVNASVDDFIGFWELFKKTDFSKYQNLKESDFEYNAPDLSNIEILKVVVEGKTLAEFEQSYKLLKKPLREPLVGLYIYLREKLTTLLKQKSGS